MVVANIFNKLGARFVGVVVELAGYDNILAKCIGSNNPHNMVKATMAALGQLRQPEAIAEVRGKSVAEIR